MSMNNLCFAIILLLSLEYAQPNHVKSQDKNWDLLIFTQHWPATVCKIWMEKPAHTCALPSKEDTWTIHGVWPTKLGSMGPAFCNKTWLFDPEEIKPIETPLEQSWINIEKETSLYSLWAHEWNKHGTCAAAIEPLNSQIKYFTNGLDWLKNYTMSNILKEANIIPSADHKYDVKDFYNAIKNKLGVNPVVECRNESGKQYIFELRICFKKSLELTDCDGVIGDETVIDGVRILSNCRTWGGIIYPPNEKPPKRILVQLHKLTTWLQWLTL